MYILVNTPYIKIPAGVANHYLGLRHFFSNKVIYNQYLPGDFIKRKIKILWLYKPTRVLTFVFDLLKFIFFILFYHRPIVLLNPSFGETALRRDLQFLRLGKLLGCKVGVFFHGWDQEYLSRVFKGKVEFNPLWKQADCFFVLASEFKEYLGKLGIKVPIYLATTKVNDQMLRGVPERKTFSAIRSLLFLARVEKTKGIFITIDAYHILKNRFPDLTLRVVGSGNALGAAKKYVDHEGISDVHFTGPLFDDELRNEFLTADLYLLPTHGEGMPTSVLEAMAFGLPVITRPVGGLKDFFENGKMGYLIESLAPQDYAKAIKTLIEDVPNAQEISVYNKRYAKDHFMASKVAPFIENKLKNL